MSDLTPPRPRPVTLDCCFDQGTGWQQIPTARAFTGTALRFSLPDAGTGAEIDADSGLLHVPTGQPHGGIVIRVQAENAAGAAVIEVQVVVEDDGSRAPTRTLSTLTVDGITFSFERPVQTGHFVSGAAGAGDPFVIGPVRLLGYDPAPSTGPDDRAMNGAMLNPICSDSVGFDSLASRNAYDPALNAGLRLPLDLRPGDRLIVSRSNPAATRAREVAEGFVVLTVLEEVPFEDAFRPPYTAPAAEAGRPIWRLSDLRLDRLAGLDLHGRRPTADELAALEARFDRFALDFVPNWNRTHLSTPLHPPLYGRDVCQDEALPYLWVNSAQPLEDKARILIGLVQRGIDRYGVFRSGAEQGFHPWRADGGHHSGRKASILFAGLMLGDAGMLDLAAQSAALGGGFHEDDQTFHVTPEDVALTNGPDWNPPYGNDEARPKIPYAAAMIGIPDWRGSADPARSNAAWTGHPYRIGGNHHSQHGQVLMLLATGLRAAWGNEAYFDYHMRHTAIMSGQPDPWRFQGGAQALYDPVEGSRPPGGWAGWELYWRAPEVYQAFAAQIARFYRFPWDGG